MNEDKDKQGREKTDKEDKTEEKQTDKGGTTNKQTTIHGNGFSPSGTPGWAK